MKKVLKKEMGITLIALVITIVVLIILASVAITLSLGENGVFKKAAKAKEDTLVAQNEESMQIAQATNSIDEIIGGSARETADKNLSLEEHVIGKWLDGKTLYSKTIYISALPNSTTKTNYQHGISNIDLIWADNSSSFIIWDTGRTASFPVISSNDKSVILAITETTTENIQIKADGNRSTIKAYITLNYTKNN